MYFCCPYEQAKATDHKVSLGWFFFFFLLQGEQFYSRYHSFKVSFQWNITLNNSGEITQLIKPNPSTQTTICHQSLVQQALCVVFVCICLSVSGKSIWMNACDRNFRLGELHSPQCHRADRAKREVLLYCTHKTQLCTLSSHWVINCHTLLTLSHWVSVRESE